MKQTSSIGDRFEQVVARVARPRQLSPNGRRLGLAAAAALFAVTAFLGVENLDDLGDTNWWLIIAAFAVGVPITVWLNAQEFRASATLVGATIPMRKAITVTIIGSAANLLPIPGSTVVRLRALTNAGARLGRAATSTATIGVLWLAVSFTLAGIGSLADGRIGVGSAFTFIGAVGLAGGAVLTKRSSDAGDGAGHPGRWSMYARILAIEVGFVLTGGLRYLALLHGIGADATLGQALALTISGSMATAASFFPGGLGIRELLAGATGPLVALPAATSLVVSVIDRIGWTAMLGVAAIVLSIVGDDQDVPRDEATVT